jgi:hypothetical protein
MIVFKRLIAAAIVAAGFTSPSMSQTAPAASPPTPDALVSSQPAITELSPAKRAEIARDLIKRWLPTVQKRPGGGGMRWQRMLTAAIAEADASNALRATTATSVEQLHDILNGYVPDTPLQSSSAIGNGAVAPQVLGDTTRDTVYTPLPNGRCRVADSRVINSPIPAAATRFLVLEDAANYASQGGNGTYANGTGSTNCGMPLMATAYAFSITLLSPAANGVFKILPYGSAAQTGNSILFNAGDFGANGDVIVRNCRGCAYEMSISSSARIHYVIDVIGYFMPPQATPLACYYSTAVTQYPGPGVSFTVAATACAAGYTAVSMVCQAGRDNMPYRSVGNGQCAGINNSGASTWVQANQLCCRVPGR